MLKSGKNGHFAKAIARQNDQSKGKLQKNIYYATLQLDKISSI